ncbi:efflux RND transporter periplasmic adaptor subunit [Aliikangiella marina]|uniref:Efflux RND transporter periplasmic adaptor subunit n=1 Tax=Aliikangiella marina TaxID=1712262 RepID=A0A545TI09_9GAMM|nr:efflux RND transporter periplasmic adaptor subunit [Aliikangiella marina]TQV76801.1 efflux RND transporter periplasmic adaptor subunit [Aliikangiella marina]
MKIVKTILTVGFLSLLLSACEQEKPIVEKTYRPVQYTKVMPSGGQNKQTFSGVTEAGLDAQLSFRVSGTIAKRLVKLGEEVSAGQVLSELDATDYRVGLQQAQASLQQALANQRNQKANYERVIDLYENSNASKSDLDAARAGAESAEASVDVSRKQVESAELQLAYTQIKAPQACSIAAVLADTNETVAAGQGVLRINCGRCIKVRVSIPEQFIQLIKTGSNVQVSASARPDKVYSGIVSEVGVAAASAGTFPVEVILQGDCAELRTGMSANVQFDFSDQLAGQGKIFVPYLSVGEDEKGHFVFVLVPTNDDIYRAEKRHIVIGAPAQNGLQIASGLTQGELIATAGVRRLLEGMEVKLLDKPILKNN